MRAFEWSDLFRLLAALAMAYGAYVSFKRMPPPLRYLGRRYYARTNGSFTTIWGRRVTDPVILVELAKLPLPPPRAK
jgi:hypothetical protein